MKRGMGQLAISVWLIGFAVGGFADPASVDWPRIVGNLLMGSAAGYWLWPR